MAAPSPDLEQLMAALVQRAKLLLSLRGVVLAQKVRRTCHRCAFLVSDHGP